MFDHYGNMVLVDEDMMLRKHVTQQIRSITLSDKELVITTDRGRIAFTDKKHDTQGNYIRTDDALHDFVGAYFLSAILKGWDSLPSDFTHDVQFLEVVTTNGSLSICSHNEHDGWYCGFDVVVTGEYTSPS